MCCGVSQHGILLFQHYPVAQVGSTRVAVYDGRLLARSQPGSQKMLNLITSLQHAVLQAAQNYYRLVILAGAQGSGKTAALRQLSVAANYPLLNVNLELSRKLLDFSRAQRTQHVERQFRELLLGCPEPVVLLDNIEILFDTALEIHPLRLLQACSRNRTLVASWNGACTAESLTYAKPGHPEHLSLTHLKASDVILLSPETELSQPRKVTAS